MRYLPAGAIVLLISLLQTPALAQMGAVESLEWTVARHPVVVVARQESHPSGRAHFKVLQQLKGPPSDRITFGELHLNRPSPGQEFLVCAVPTDTPGIYDLDQRDPRRPPIFPLDGSAVGLFDVSALPLKSREDILAAARVGVAVRQPPASRKIVTPFRGPGNVDVIVPDDPAVEATLRRLLTSTDEKAVEHGISVLYGFGPTPENVAAMRGVLSSRAHSDEQTRLGRWTWSHYGARSKAAYYLRRWRIPVDAPLNYGFIEQHAPVRGRWIAAAVVALVLLVIVTARAGRPRRLVRVLAVLSILILAAIVILWTRSYTRADELVHATPTVDRELWTYRGLFIGVAVRPWHDARPPGFRSVDITSTNQHSLQHWRKTSSHAWLGFETATGPLPTLNDANATATAIVIPMWAVCLPLLPAPVLWLAANLRARHRKRRGLCVRCGYDLRESTTHCPECGLSLSL